MSSSVHRITVREMNEIQCRRQLAVVKRRFKQWNALANRSQYHQPRIAQIKQAYQQLMENEAQVATLSARNLSLLNNQLVEFTGTLNNEVQEVREQQLEKQALLARTKKYREHNLAELIALVHEKLPNETELLTQLISASELDENQSNKLIFKVLALLSSQSTSLTPSAAALLSQLKAQSEGVKQFWQSGLPQTPFAKQREQLLLMIEKLKLIASSDEAQRAEQQLVELQEFKEGTQRHLRADSLIMTLAGQLKLSQQRIELIDKIEQLCDELAIFASNENEAMISNALASIQSSSIEVLTAWIGKLNNAVNTAEQQVVATAQRKTVLEGLGKLGYQVQDTDVKAWLDDGKVVVTHPATPGYGLELGGKQARFQARTVAFSAERDNSRDQDVDAIWCNQHQQLQDIIAQTDAELVVEQALPAGRGEMKVYETQSKDQRHNIAVNHLKTRSK
ncbi:hypothetical protein ABN069_11260 [Providencia rettgeri]|uniref:Uncharacterized protein n=1 Tax=Providencia hangzhouensis TaxID=3031799 RepID=A0ABY9Z4X5_9GAMM|nr:MULTISPECIES: hypothetical protein [Providencia]MCL0010612.1 hypothetical protein [Providencia rettgeri]WNK22788.1 hypothetical protein PZ638_12565 [Providencia hangzhouensis]BBV01893.1 hypothetical protein BML2526_35450 [Providencia rettgeri]BBV12983.1 hypothetical protein BML2576_24420 [Providencia rettgeri]BDH19087.1 hypothetical protein PrNR1418_23780 [Providencia rettgeri]